MLCTVWFLYACGYHHFDLLDSMHCHNTLSCDALVEGKLRAGTPTSAVAVQRNNASPLCVDWAGHCTSGPISSSGKN